MNKLKENVKSAKYYQRPNWDTHIDNIGAKANKTLGFVKRIVRTRQNPIKIKE